MGKAWLKYVILVVYIVLLIVVGFVIAYFGSNKCVRKSCTRKVNFILNSMNSEIDPCTNFYQYSCENYKSFVHYRRGGVASVMDHIKYDIEEVLDRFLKTPVKITDDRILKIIKNMYQPCTDLSLINLQGVQPLWDAIWMTGGFPVVDGDDWDEKAFSVGAFEYKSRKNGFSSQHIFQSDVEEDTKHPDTYLVYIKPPAFKKLPGNELVTEKYSDKLRVNYLSFVVRLTFHLLNKTNYEDDSEKEIRQRYEKELNKTLDFKMALGKHLSEYWDEQDPVDLYNLMSLDTLQSELPFVDWKDYFKNMLPASTKMPNKIIVIGTSYFNGIKELMQNTPKRTIANFLMAENAFEGSLFLPQDFFSIYNKFRSNIGLPNAIRSPFCEGVIKDTMRGALSSLFLQTYNFTEGSQPILEDIAGKMRSDIRRSIEDLDWMDEKTKENAILKLKKTKFTLSLSDRQILELQDVEARAKYYEDLCLGRRRSHVLPSYFCINKFHLKKNWELLTRAPTVFDEPIDVFTSDIRYNAAQNEILIPYGLLKYPAFDGIWPKYLNYGGIGSIFGVVFTHGFDSVGANFNDLGFKKNWWTSKTKALYRHQNMCFEDEYVDYAKKSNNITVKSTEVGLSQKIANFEGVNLAYNAYSDYANHRFLKEQSLPRLENFTSKQLFFLGFANIHCSYYKKKKLQFMLQNSVDVPYDFEVIESLHNLKSFSDEFKCKRGDKMNPKRKCKFLWKSGDEQK